MNRPLIFSLMFTAFLALAGAVLAWPSSIMISGKTTAPVVGTVACDYGPNTTLPTGGAGTDAVTAGFTHCILNADFTDNSGAHVASGGGTTNWVMNDPTTWLNQCTPGGATSTWGKFYLTWQSGSPVLGSGFGTNSADPPPQVPCARAVMTTDGASSVLQFQYTHSDDVTTGSGIQGIQLMWPACGNPCAVTGPALPIPLYEEITYRLSAGISQPFTSDFMTRDENTVYDGGCTGCSPQPSGFLDDDVQEIFPNNFVVNSSTPSSGGPVSSMDVYGNFSPCASFHCSTGMFWNPDLANYHNYAYLGTTDGSTTMTKCFYVDGTGGFTGPAFPNADWDGTFCSHWFDFNGHGDFLNNHTRRFNIMLMNVQPGAATFNPIVINIKRIRIFACATWQGFGNNCTTAQSSGSIVFH